MINHIHSMRTSFALLIVIMTVTIGAGIPISVYAGDGKDPLVTLSHDKRMKIRHEEEKTLKSKDKLYTEHAKSLAEQYQQTAKIVKKQGGDPTPLLAAATYFLNESKSD